MLQLFEALILLSIMPTTWFFSGGWNSPSPFQKYTGGWWKSRYVIERRKAVPNYHQLPCHELRQIEVQYEQEFDNLSRKQRRLFGEDWERRRSCGCSDCKSGVQVPYFETYVKISRRQRKLFERKVRNAERIARKELDAFGYSPSSQLP